MRNLLLLALGLAGACGGASSDHDTTPAPDTTAPHVEAPRPDSQPTRPADVTVTTDTRSYRAGDPVELRIVSHSASRFTYNPCTRTLEREDDGVADSWTEVKEERMCTMVAHVLDPDSTRIERTELGEELGPGRYRMLVRFASDKPAPRAVSVTAYTMPFTVTSTR